MGNIVGRPRRRGLPTSTRALVPGSTLSDVRDGDVVVLCSSDGTPLRLEVAADADRAAGRASTSGRHGAGAGTSEHATFTPAFTLVPGADALPDALAGSLANAANHVVVDVRGRHVAFRSVAAGDAYLCFETNDDERGEERETTFCETTHHKKSSARLRFRGGAKHVRRRGLWRWAYDETADEVRFAPRGMEFVNEFFVVAVGPRRTTRVAAARAWAEHLRLELEARARLADDVRHLRARAADARAGALANLASARDRAEARARLAETRRERRERREELRFLDGLTGVVDALRDQVKGAATEPVNAMEVFEASFERDEDAGDESESEKETRKKRAPWRVDAAHLATAAAVWDLSVTDFRAALQKHGVEDEPVAALQEAIQKSAFEHFVAAGMRRYLLNRDEEDEEDEEDENDEETRVSSASAAASTASSPVSFSSRRGSPAGALSPARTRFGEVKKAPVWERAVGAESRRRRDARARRAERRARLKARARAGEAAVDFRTWKVGSLRAQLERSGVDAGPLAALVHCLAHAARVRGSDLYVSAASAAFSGPETGETVGDEDSPRRTTSASDAFRAVLAREKLGEDLRYLRSERLDVAADAGFAAMPPTSPERARVAAAMASPAKGKENGALDRGQTTPFSALRGSPRTRSARSCTRSYPNSTPISAPRSPMPSSSR